VRAYVWMHLVALQGNTAAGKFLEILSKEMSEEQIDQARKLARQYQEKIDNQ